MPTKESYLIAFLTISGILFLMQWFVYRRLRRIVHRDFPDRAARLLRISRWVFVLMNIPVVFLFFRRQISLELPTLTIVLLVPFTIWQSLMIVWTLILAPIAGWEFIRNRVRNLSHPRA